MNRISSWRFAALASACWCLLVLSLALAPSLALADDPAAPSLASLEFKTVEVNEAALAYRVLGQGEPLLCVMGYGGTMDVWDPAMIAALAKSYAVILFDNRDAGYSTATDAPFSMKLFADDAAGLLDALHIESAHILGWSMGAIIGLELALDRPEKVRKLILYGAVPDNVQVMKAVEAMAKLPKGGLKDILFPKAWLARHPDIFTRLPSPAKPVTKEVIERQRQALADWPGVTQRLSDLDRQTLLIYGEEDDITPLSEGLRLAGGIKGSWLARFEGGGHWLMYQAPQEMARLMTLFLQEKQNLLQQE